MLNYATSVILLNSTAVHSGQSDPALWSNSLSALQWALHLSLCDGLQSPVSPDPSFLTSSNLSLQSTTFTQASLLFLKP